VTEKWPAVEVAAGQVFGANSPCLQTVCATTASNVGIGSATRAPDRRAPSGAVPRAGAGRPPGRKDTTLKEKVEEIETTVAQMLPPLSSKLCGDRPGAFKGLFDLNSKEFKHAAGAGRPPGRKGPMLKEEVAELGDRRDDR
jgi:hypothetical protein